MNDELNTGDQRYLAHYPGKVKNNADPNNKSRVTVSIPGLIDETDWALPAITMGGGAPQGGGSFVPPIGADVIVFFLLGDPNCPRYMGGHWGDGEVLTPLQALSPEDAPQVATIEWGPYTVTLDKRPGMETFAATHKLTGDKIEHDGALFGWTIKGTTSVNIVADGSINLKAGAGISFNGRWVAPSSDDV